MFSFKKLSNLILCNLNRNNYDINYSCYFMASTFNPVDRSFPKTAPKVLKMGRHKPEFVPSHFNSLPFFAGI